MNRSLVWRAIVLAGWTAALTACGGYDGAPAGGAGGNATGGGGSGSVSSFGGTSAGSATGSGGSAGVASTGGAAGGGGAAGAADAGAVVCRASSPASSITSSGPGKTPAKSCFPKPILGPPKGGGCCQGSLDVVSLGNGGHVTVEFGSTEIVDGPGPDFIVFENAFDVGGDPEQPFAELASVAVSDDAKTWHEFPCTASSFPYGSCAGWHPVFANPDENEIDPLDPAVAGGDAFDLADLGVAHARYVRITDRADTVGVNGVFDLDAVGLVHAECH